MHPASSDATADHSTPGHRHRSPTRRRRPQDDRVAPLSAFRGHRPGGRTLARFGAGTIAVAALVAGTVAIDAPLADAATVPYAVGFEDEVPAIAPGGVTDLYLDCPGQGTSAAMVLVTDPGANVVQYEAVPVDNNGTPRVRVTVGPTGTFTATEVGTWSVSVSCGGFDPFVSSFEVVAPQLTFTTRLDRDFDCTTVDTAFLPGDRARACLTVTNNTCMDLLRIGVHSDTTGSFSYPDAGDVGPGETFETAVSPGAAADFAGGSIDGIRVWAELGSNGSGAFATSATESFTYGPVGPPIGLTATTGLDASTACAAQGGLADRTVAPGTPVYLCYTMTNTSGAPYHFHDIDDSVLGNLYTGLENDVDTFESMTWSPAQPLVVTASQTHVGTWSSTEDDEEGYSALPEGFVAVAHATATITVTAAPAPAPTTTTTSAPAPTSTTVPTTAPTVAVVLATPAVPVAVSPHLAG